MATVSITINGIGVEAEVEARTHLADFIREHRNLTGTHLGCEHGVCGACTVLIDGAPARSCITYAVACDGASITTVEGLEDDVSAELRDAFSREHALQCGYCTPGMLVSARDAVLRLPEPDDREIRVLLSGNLCSCGCEWQPARASRLGPSGGTTDRRCSRRAYHPRLCSACGFGSSGQPAPRRMAAAGHD